MLKLLVFFSSILLTFAFNKDEITELTNDTIEQFLNLKESRLIEFYSPISPHSKSFDTHFQQIFTKFKATGVYFSRVNYPQHQNDIKGFEVDNYPCIYYVSAFGAKHLYKGELKQEEIENFIELKKSLKPIEDVETKNEFLSKVRANNVKQALVIVSERASNPDIADSLISFAQNVGKLANVFWTNDNVFRNDFYDEETENEEKAAFYYDLPDTKAFYNFTLYDPGAHSYTFMYNHMKRVVFKETDATELSILQKYEIPTLIFLYSKDSDLSFASYSFEKQVKNFMNRVVARALKFGSSSAKPIEDYFKVKESELPVILIYKAYKSHQFFQRHKVLSNGTNYFTETRINKVLHHFSEGELRSFTKSEQVVEGEMVSNMNMVHKIVATNFIDFFSYSDIDKVFFFPNKTSEEYTGLKEIYQRVVNIVQPGNQNITFAELDLLENEVEGLEVENLPGLGISFSKTSAGVKLFSGEFTVENVLAFIQNYTKYQLSNLTSLSDDYKSPVNPVVFKSNQNEISLEFEAFGEIKAPKEESRVTPEDNLKSLEEDEELKKFTTKVTKESELQSEQEKNIEKMLGEIEGEEDTELTDKAEIERLQKQLEKRRNRTKPKIEL